MPKPFFQIMQGETDVTARVGQGNISLTITDGVGENADTIQFTIDDQNGIIAPPETGVEIRVLAGYVDDYRDFGLFTVDSVDLKGWPQEISVTGQSVGAKTAAKEKRKASYKKDEFPTYGKVFETLAGRNSLSLTMANDLKSKALKFEAQSEESDLAFATRLGKKIGASVTVKNKNLVVVSRGAGKSASGQRLPVIYVIGDVNVKSYTVSLKDKPKHKTVKATWFDRDEAKTKELEEESFGEGPVFLLREPFPSEEDAKEAAKAKAEDLKRGIGTASFEIDGNPYAMAEADVEAYGIRSLVDGTWRAQTVTHTFSGSAAYSVTVACESPEAGPTSTQPKLPALSTVPIPTPRPG
ncbi:late control protein D [Aurantimonas sp. DM33-3]|uniref:phage late control D family protein n=1 Tax=Aurantimonas sp. DM33-3 TaxID=2766955 RepID=UPI0016525553|nr:contractile injection system protein, VgrG/Pvc8 family [Aurantimonas sp. DM33-3]MBC6714807.1 late control protein D [Aurantimonas sp. DM33-3]